MHPKVPIFFEGDELLTPTRTYGKHLILFPIHSKRSGHALFLFLVLERQERLFVVRVLLILDVDANGWTAISLAHQCQLSYPRQLSASAKVVVFSTKAKAQLTNQGR
jgi:hypothetical protein